MKQTQGSESYHVVRGWIMEALLKKMEASSSSK
jgi:hypothetical protein